MRFCLFIFSLLFISSSLQAQKSAFSLTGKTNNIKDGSWLYFRDLVDGATLDSARVQHNSFKFNTKLSEPRMWVMLYTKDRSKFTEVWLQENPMYFDAANRKFEQAKITGSASQQLVEEVRTIYKDLDRISATELRKRQSKFIYNHRNTLISARMLYEVMGTWGQQATASYFKLFPKELQKSSFGKRILSFLSNDSIPQIGEKFVDFELPDPRGKKKKFSEITEKVTLLQFWAATCNPSKIQNKELKRLNRKYKADGFQIVAVSRDTQKEAWVSAIEKDNLKWPQLSSLKGWKGPVFSKYGIRKTPSNYLINSDGKVVAINLSGDELKENIQNLLKE